MLLCSYRSFESLGNFRLDFGPDQAINNTTRLPVSDEKQRGYHWIPVDSIGKPSPSATFQLSVYMRRVAFGPSVKIVARRLALQPRRTQRYWGYPAEFFK